MYVYYLINKNDKFISKRQVVIAFTSHNPRHIKAHTRTQTTHTRKLYSKMVLKHKKKNVE